MVYKFVNVSIYNVLVIYFKWWYFKGYGYKSVKKMGSGFTSDCTKDNDTEKT